MVSQRTRSSHAAPTGWDVLTREVRDLGPYTQKELGQEIGRELEPPSAVSARAVQDWEAGKSIPLPRHRRALVRLRSRLLTEVAA